MSKYLLLPFITAIVTGCFSSTPPPASVLHSDTYSTLTSKELRMLPESDKIFTIEDAVRIGLANNPTYEKTSLSLDLAYNTFYEALFSYLPTVSVSAGNVGISQDHTVSRGDGKWDSTTTYGSPSLAGTGSFVVFNGLQREMDLLIKYEGIKETADALKFVRLTLINQIINLYYTLVLTKENIAINEANLSFQKEMLENARFTYKNNLVTYDYVLNFELNYKTQQAEVVKLKLDYKTQEIVLAVLLGLTTAEFPSNIKYLPIEDLIRNLKRDYSSLGVEYYLDIAIDQRPDLKQVRSALKAQRFELYSTWGKFAPTISATANYGLTTSDWEYSGQSISYGLTASWELLDAGMSRIFNVRSAQINLAQSKLDVLSKWIDIVGEVRTAYVKLQMSLIDEQLRSEAVEFAKKQRDMVKEKYENQIESITRLNQVQSLLVTAQLTKTTSIISVYKAKTGLNSACGIQRY